MDLTRESRMSDTSQQTETSEAAAARPIGIDRADPKAYKAFALRHEVAATVLKERILAHGSVFRFALSAGGGAEFEIPVDVKIRHVPRDQINAGHVLLQLQSHCMKGALDAVTVQALLAKDGVPLEGGRKMYKHKADIAYFVEAALGRKAFQEFITQVGQALRWQESVARIREEHGRQPA